MPEFTDITIPTYLVSLLFAAPIPTLVIFMKFLPLVHALFSSLRVYFFYIDYGILYEELLVRAKKHKLCCICMIYVHVRIYIRICAYVYISLSLMTTFSNNMAALAVLS